MSEQDRSRWDRRYNDDPRPGEPGLPGVFRPHGSLFPVEGRALEVACGPGEASVWLALRGMDVLGVDVSPVAIDLARGLASEHGVTDHCRFEVHDLDLGLPAGPQADVLLCHLFRDPRLDLPMIDRLAPDGLLAIAALSGGGREGRFRTEPGELRRAFDGLEILGEGDDGRVTWLIGRQSAGIRSSQGG